MTSTGQAGPVVDQNGRPLGPRALRTRSRLLEATRRLLDERPLRDVAVVDIARRAGTSPATFYQYFKGPEEAILELAARAADEMPGVLEELRGLAPGPGALPAARAFVRAFIAHWDRHRAVLLVRNLAAESGDRRFARVRRRALGPLLERLAALTAEGQRSGNVSRHLNPHAGGAALASIVERLSAYHRELEPTGVSLEDLVETTARILVQVATGTPPD